MATFTRFSNYIRDKNRYNKEFLSANNLRYDLLGCTKNVTSPVMLKRHSIPLTQSPHPFNYFLIIY